jgi:hypothetical protein
MEGRRPPGPRGAAPSRVCPCEEMAGWVFSLCYPGRCPPILSTNARSQGKDCHGGGLHAVRCVECVPRRCSPSNHGDTVRQSPLRASPMQSGATAPIPASRPIRSHHLARRIKCLYGESFSVYFPFKTQTLSVTFDRAQRRLCR